MLDISEEELQEKIVRVLETQKALIVIDDIWREGDWDRIKHVFVPKKGWKVLLTSRNEEVALHANNQCVTFRPEFLSFEESWHLFQKITFPMKDTTEFKADEEMDEMGKQMIKPCGGLPLAIKVLGGLLASQYTLHEWRRVYEDIRSYIIGGTSFEEKNINSVFHILYLSFEELPVYLKQCFLYFAHYPENFPIYVEDLAYHWNAEGIPRPRHYSGASIREIADGYIEELVKRNMIFSERDVGTSRFKTCKLHDMMRQVCLLKAEEENFVEIIGTSTANSKYPCQSRRLAVDRRDKNLDVEAMVKNRRLRSLLFIEGSRWMESRICFASLTLMRVLDLSGAKLEGGRLPSSIGKLIHLRYLSLSEAYVTHLPSSMRNLKQLLYLNLEVSTLYETYMPNFLKDMRELTYLYLPRAIHTKVKMELGNLVNLETLENFSIKHGRVEDLQGMTRLRDLSIYIRGEGCTTEKLSSSLSGLRYLETLTIRDHNSPTNDDDEIFVLDCIRLTHLSLTIYMPTLPDEQHLSSHLTTIWLEQCYLEEDPMPVLEKLRQLIEVGLSVRSFCGRRIVCSSSGFPRLQRLFLEELKYLQEWIVEEGSMPVLQSLDIQGCKKLKQLPDGVLFMNSLQVIRVGLKGEQWKKVLLEGHLPSLTTIHLSQCRLKEDPMPVLEKLLHLKEISLGAKSFCGKTIVCSSGSFLQLQTLHFCGLKEWEEWIVEEGSMPLLLVVRIFFCRKLKEIPDRLRNLTIC